MQKLVLLLKQHNLTIASCESFTGGLFAEQITSIAGSSQVFKGAIISYATSIKQKFSLVDIETIKKMGVVSDQAAKQMAANIKELMGVDIGISFTGNAGPSAMEDKPVGLFYIGIQYNQNSFSYVFQVNHKNRRKIRLYAIKKAIEIISNFLK